MPETVDENWTREKRTVTRKQMRNGKIIIKMNTMNQNNSSNQKMGGRKVESIKQNPLVKKVGFNRIVLCIVLLLMYGLFCALTGGAFVGMRRIMSALNYA